MAILSRWIRSSVYISIYTHIFIYIYKHTHTHIIRILNGVHKPTDNLVSSNCEYCDNVEAQLWNLGHAAYHVLTMAHMGIWQDATGYNQCDMWGLSETWTHSRKYLQIFVTRLWRQATMTNRSHFSDALLLEPTFLLFFYTRRKSSSNPVENWSMVH